MCYMPFEALYMVQKNKIKESFETALNDAMNFYCRPGQKPPFQSEHEIQAYIIHRFLLHHKKIIGEDAELLFEIEREYDKKPKNWKKEKEPRFDIRINSEPDWRDKTKKTQEKLRFITCEIKWGGDRDIKNVSYPQIYTDDLNKLNTDTSKHKYFVLFAKTVKTSGNGRFDCSKLKEWDGEVYDKINIYLAFIHDKTGSAKKPCKRWKPIHYGKRDIVIYAPKTFYDAVYAAVK